MAEVNYVRAPKGEVEYLFFTIVAIVDGRVAKIAVAQEFYNGMDGEDFTGSFIAMVQHGATQTYKIQPRYSGDDQWFTVPSQREPIDFSDPDNITFPEPEADDHIDYDNQVGWKCSSYWLHAEEVFKLIEAELNKYIAEQKSHLN